MSALDDDLWASFRADADDSLRGIEESLLVLERQPRDVEGINRLYRGMHTLKSNAGYLRLLGLEHLAHISEDAMGDVRTGTIAFDSALADLLLRVVDRLRTLVNEAAPGAGETIPRDIEDLCRDIQAMCAAKKGAPPPPRVRRDPSLPPEPVAYYSAPAPLISMAPPIDPQDDPEYLSIFLAMARDQFRLLTEATGLFATGGCSEQDARDKIKQTMEELGWASERMGYLLLAETVSLLAASAGDPKAPISSLPDLEFDLCEQLVAIEARYKALAPSPEDFGLERVFRSSCARSLFADLAELQRELEAPSGITAPGTKRRFRRLLIACEEYGLRAAEGELAACQDVVYRAIDSGERLEALALEKTHALLRRVGAAAYALDTNPEAEEANQFGAFLPTKAEAALPYGLSITKELGASLSDDDRHRLSDLIDSGHTILELATPGTITDAASGTFYAWVGQHGAQLLGSYLDPKAAAPDCLFLFAIDGRRTAIGQALAKLKRDVEGVRSQVVFGEIPAEEKASNVAPPLSIRPAAVVHTPKAAPAVEATGAREVEAPDPGGREAEAIPERSKEDGKGRGDEYVRVGSHKLALVMELAGEIGLASGSVTSHPDLEGLELEGFSSAAHKLEVLVRELQSEVAALRLLPVDGIFQRMRRVARDAARRTGKQVELEFVGEDTEIDKVMLDSLAEPLVHLVRNAIDHGIESAADRLAAGKPAAGRLVLEAAHESGEAILQLTDDGGGLNTAAILTRARERGLVKEGAVLSDEEITNLITIPGFSTKQAVDELSGRGVGMDVVRTTVEGLRGKLRVRSIAGKGTRVTMRMPLTLAFIDAMIIRSINSLFAVPIERVHEVFRVQPSQVVRSSAEGTMMLRVREHLVPVCWLHKFFGQAGDETGIIDQVVVVVQGATTRLALPVDTLLGNQTIMLKPMTGVLSLVRAASGCGMLRSGDVALALDCEQLNA